MSGQQLLVLFPSNGHQVGPPTLPCDVWKINLSLTSKQFDSMGFQVGFSVNDRGAAYVFERNQGGVADNWGQVTRLRASDAANNDYFGYAVAISGDQIIVGAYGENGAGTDRGAAYIFYLQPYEIHVPLVVNNN